MALLSNSTTSDWADVFYVSAAAGSRAYIEFITHCSDGAQLDTNNSATAPVHFPMPNDHVFRFPQINDVFTLYRAHRMPARQNIKGDRPAIPPRGQEVAELQRA